MYKSIGILRCFNKWALLECDDQIGAMYRSLYSLEYFYKPKIQKPLWGTHISIIRGELLLNNLIKKDLIDLSVEYYFMPCMMTNSCHFWLPVVCPILDDIREVFGLDKSPVNYHLSVGNIKDDSGVFRNEEYF